MDKFLKKITLMRSTRHPSKMNFGPNAPTDFLLVSQLAPAQSDGSEKSWQVDFPALRRRDPGIPWDTGRKGEQVAVVGRSALQFLR